MKVKLEMTKQSLHEWNLLGKDEKTLGNIVVNAAWFLVKALCNPEHLDFLFEAKKKDFTIYLGAASDYQGFPPEPMARLVITEKDILTTVKRQSENWEEGDLEELAGWFRSMATQIEGMA